MAQFDVHTLGGLLVVDCQSNILKVLESRLVVPLVPRRDAPEAAGRLNPIFEIHGVEYVTLTQAAAAVHKHELGTVVASLANRSFEITGALDVLISGV